MTEQTMRQRVVKALKPLDAWSVENPCRPGTPDVNYIEGWIELKWCEKWPVRTVTPVRLPHFTPQQKLHLRRRWHMGGNAYLLLQVDQDWFLLNGEEAAMIVGQANREMLEQHSIWFKRSPDLRVDLTPHLSR